MCHHGKTLLIVIKDRIVGAMAGPESKSLENGRLLGPDETVALIGASALGGVNRG